MLSLLSKALSYFWRRADDEDERWATSDDKELKRVQGVVTRLCHDYGMIDDMIVFTKDVVTKNMLLAVGQEVIATVEEDKTSGGLKAVRLSSYCGNTVIAPKYINLVTEKLHMDLQSN
ncbi:cancer/testis antigen 55 [Poecile atricapillus]|uniref:cancer/testis antigen 55 n=1 Tax=Poecile atricapillus TaxID=48891 RepID=UPI00273A4AAD|nr:cancer/testis antigen 55 [Poecile atricapillus]